MYEIYVNADTNDADYTSSISNLKEEDIPKVKQAIELLKTHSPSWRPDQIKFENGDIGDTLGELEEKLTPEDFEIIAWFDECFIPYGEYGIHTIESVEIYPMPEKEKLL